MGVRYRLARPQDALAIGRLARRVTRRWILPEQPASAAASLLYGMGAQVIRRKILAGQRFHLAWQDDGHLAGVAAMRDDCHLFQFFVSTRLHGRGIARQLWQRTLRDAYPPRGHAALHAELFGHGRAGVSAPGLCAERPAEGQRHRPGHPADAARPAMKRGHRPPVPHPFRGFVAAGRVSSRRWGFPRWPSLCSATFFPPSESPP